MKRLFTLLILFFIVGLTAKEATGQECSATYDCWNVSVVDVNAIDHTITFDVDGTACSSDISFFAVEISDESDVEGHSSTANYHWEFTDNTGKPGFPSFKFELQENAKQHQFTIDFSNDFTIPDDLRIAAKNGGGPEVERFRFEDLQSCLYKDLTLTSMCNWSYEHPPEFPNGKAWRVINPNSYDVFIDYVEVYGHANYHTDGLIATPEPDRIFFSTPDVGQPNTIKIYYTVNGEQRQETKAANTCVLPVELVSFDYTVDGRDVILTWETASETNNAGFEVQRDEHTIAFVDGNGTTTVPQSYSFRDNELNPNNYTYRLKQVDFDGAFEYSPSVEVSIEAREFYVTEPYPNPSIGFVQLRVDNVTSTQNQMDVYDIMGRKVLSYTNVDGIKLIDTSQLAAGKYFVRVQNHNTLITKTFIVK